LLRALGARLGLGLEATAAGVLEISAWNQANALRQVTVKRGLDVRDFVLAAFIRDLSELRRREEQRAIPSGLDFSGVPGLSNEIKQKLRARGPKSLAEAQRIDGMTHRIGASISEQTKATHENLRRLQERLAAVYVHAV